MKTVFVKDDFKLMYKAMTSWDGFDNETDKSITDEEYDQTYIIMKKLRTIINHHEKN